MKMFVFGINLPVAEILFVLLLLFIVGIAVIIVQLLRMGKHIRVLDETTLEIRRYEAEEEISLKVQTANIGAMDANAKRAFTQQYLPAVSGLYRAAATQLVSGKTPEQTKRMLVAKGAPETVATRAVNNAIVALNAYAAFTSEEARGATKRLSAAAKSR